MFGAQITAMNDRKLILMHMRHQPPHVQLVVALAESHSLAVAERHYNFAPASEVVESA